MTYTIRTFNLTGRIEIKLFNSASKYNFEFGIANSDEVSKTWFY